jgi:outer membrane protein
MRLPRLGIAALLVAAAAPLRAQPWTVERAVGAALRGSPDAAIARARMEAADALVAQADSAWLPLLSIGGRYTDTNSPMAAFGSILNQRAFSFGLDFNHPGRIDNLGASGTLAYNLYSGGQATAARDAARAGSEAAQEERRATRNRLAADVVKAVLDIRKAREAERAMEAGVRAYEAAVAAAKARYDSGQRPRALRGVCTG